MKTATVCVSTLECDPIEGCTLSDPSGGDRNIPSPFKVKIMNDRDDCMGTETETKLYWSIVDGPSGTLRAGQCHTHPMTHDVEKLQLYYSECQEEWPWPDPMPPGTTPRITINLTKVREE